MFVVVLNQNILASVVDLLNLKSSFQALKCFIYILILTLIDRGGLNFTISVIDICTFDTILTVDEPDGQEGRRLQYLDQEKFSYITNYLAQTRDTDVHSVSTEDDSGKPGSSFAPSEFSEFEETSGMTFP